MRSKGFEGMRCSIADVLAALGDRWGAVIVRDLLLGLRRYDDLRKSTGITNSTLTDRLKHLEQHGLIERQLYQTNPDRYEYLLTPKGRELALVMQAMAQVGDRWNSAGLAGPPLKFTHAKSGRPIKLVPVDEQTGAPLTAKDMRIEAGPGADDLIRWRLSKSRK